MGDDWSKRMAQRITQEDESRRHKEKLEILREQKILDLSPQVWGEIVATIQRKVDELNHHLADPRLHINVKLAPSNRVIIRQKKPRPVSLEAYLNSDTRSVSFFLNGESQDEVTYVFDIDDNSNLGLRKGDRVLTVEEAAKDLLERLISND